MWLVSVLCHILPSAAEADALFVLMLYAEERRPAHLNGEGYFIPIKEQNPALWNAAMMDESACRRGSLARTSRSVGTSLKLRSKPPFSRAGMARLPNGRPLFCFTAGLWSCLPRWAR